MQNAAGIAFDLEGTLIDLEKLHFKAFERVVEQCGFITSFDEMVTGIPHAIGGGDQLVAEGLLHLYPIGLTPDTLVTMKKDCFQKMLMEVNIVPREGVLSFISKAQGRGIPITIGSLTPTEAGRHLLMQSGLDAFFPRENQVFLEDVQRKKPAPDVYLATADLMGIDPRQQLVFEDSIPGVLAAKSAGSSVIALPTFCQPDNMLALYQAGARKVFRRWNQVHW